MCSVFCGTLAVGRLFTRPEPHYGASNRFLWWFTGPICVPFLLATMGTYFGLAMNNAQRASALEAAPQEVRRTPVKWIDTNADLDGRRRTRQKNLG